MYGNTPRRWKDSLEGYNRLRTITNYLTRMRFIYKDGSLDMVSKGAQPQPGRNVAPWFSHPDRATAREKIIFGHWAALDGKYQNDYLYPLDTGCVWGGKMTLYKLDSNDWWECACS
jgi:bis(5'-nucleosyl)-tetraphosphatase (symmetrical)